MLSLPEQEGVIAEVAGAITSRLLNWTPGTAASEKPPVVATEGCFIDGNEVNT
jgi:hypothetical protein